MSSSSSRRRGAQRRLGMAPDRESRRGAHDRLMAEAGGRLIARALAAYRVLRRDALEQVVGAQRWHATSFEQALGTAVELGLVDRRPLGFYRSHKEPPAGRDRGSPDRR